MMPPVGRERRHLLVAAIVVAIAATAARAPGTVTYPLWQDEIASARILVEPTPWEAVGHVADTESTPPAWYVAGWLLNRLDAPVEAVRWLSVLCGAGAAVLTVVFARRFMSLPAAALAGAVVALGWQFVARGHELRAYSLYLLLSVGFALALAAAARTPTPRRLAALAFVTALGLLTHYFFALALLAGASWLAAGRPRNRRLQGRVRPLAAALALGVLPLLVWLPGFFQQVENGRYSWVADFDPLKAAAVYSTYFWNAGDLYVESEHVSVEPLAAVGRLAILALVVAGAVLLWGLGDEARLAALLATVPVALATVLWLSGGAVFTTRNLLCAAPFAAIAIAAAVAALPRPAALAAAGVALALLGVGLAQERTLRPPPYDAYAARVLAAGWQPGDPLYVRGGAHSLYSLGSSYALRSPIGWYLPGRPRLLEIDPPACRTAVVVDGGARPVRIERLPCAGVPPGGYWFRFRADSSGGQASPRLRSDPHTTQRVVV
jgi:Dolichyl-phosphate-mannose-protein mannosyltransferase